MAGVKGIDRTNDYAIAAGEPAIQRALTIEEIFWQNEKERGLYEMRQNALLDLRSELSAVRDEGREEGRMDTARAALKEGSAVEFVVKITELGRETVLRLKSEGEKECMQGIYA